MHHSSEESKKQVLTLAKIGVSQKSIASQLNISVNTLKKHYELELTKAKASFEVLLLNQAALLVAKGNATMIIFLLKTQFGFTTDPDKQKEREAVNAEDDKITAITMTVVMPKEKDDKLKKDDKSTS